MTIRRSASKTEIEQQDLEARLNQGLDQIVDMYDRMMNGYITNDPLTDGQKTALRENVVNAMKASA